MIKIHNKNIKTKGVTLIELLVAVAVFGIFIGVITGFLVSGIQVQRRTLATQDLLNQASYVIEYIARALRMAVKDTGGICVAPNANYWVNPLYYVDPSWQSYSDSWDFPTKGQGIRLLKSTDSGNVCQNFYLDPNDNILKEQTSPDENATFGSPLPLISDKIQIISFSVNVSGDLSGSSLDSESPNRQPIVTIFLELMVKDTSTGQPRVKVQTSVSQRNLDVQ